MRILHFTVSGQSLKKRRRFINGRFINGRCEVPEEVTGCKCWRVRLIGEREGYRITTNQVEVYQI